MIHFEFLNKNGLQEFISSGKFAEHPFHAITKHRALSQTKNPIISEEDILLTLAFFNGKLAGYLGTLPAELDIEGKKIKYAWLSTIYVDENFRGKKIAQKILAAIFEKYDGKIAITEFTPEAESLYLKTKQFQYIPTKIGTRFYLKADFKRILPHKKKGLKNWKWLLGIIDSTINSGIEIKNTFRKTKKIKSEILKSVDEESVMFLSEFSKNRNIEELNWILQNPWVLEEKEVDKKYLFSSYSEEFQYFWVKIFDENNRLETIAMLLLRDKHLKIPYLFHRKKLKNFKYFLTDFSIKKGVTMITSYQNELNGELNTEFPKIWKKEMERRYMFHHHLIKLLPENYENTFQDGDGDCVFT